jgi:hypothetical protein
MSSGSWGLRYPHDYNRQNRPVAYWLLQLVWIFPWSLFLPAALVVAWKTRHSWLSHVRREAGLTVDFYLDNGGQAGLDAGGCGRVCACS